MKEKADQRFYIYFHKRPDGSVFYIGKGKGNRSHDFRWNRNKHHRATVAKYGESNIGVEVYLCDSEQDALSLEVAIIGLMRGTWRLVNLTNGGEGVSGMVVSSETRRKLSDAQRGKRWSDEHRRKFTEVRKGHEVSLETRKKLSRANLGRKPSAEICAKMSAAGKARRLSAAHKEAIRQSHIGVRWPQERRDKLSTTLRLKYQTVPHPRLGIPRTPETIAKIIATKRRNNAH